MPSWMEPTMAMAPMHTVNEAVTKASTNRASLALPVFRFSQLPKRSIPSSRFNSSPIRDPRAMQPMISMAPPPVTLEPSTVSIPSKAPEMPRNRVLTPQALHRESCTPSLKNRPKIMPHTPPATIARVLMTVPSPTILSPPGKMSKSLYHGGKRSQSSASWGFFH